MKALVIIITAIVVPGGLIVLAAKVFKRAPAVAHARRNARAADLMRASVRAGADV